MNIQDIAKSQRYPKLQECTQIYKLAVFYACDESSQFWLLVYCTDRYFCFNPTADHRDWYVMKIYSSNWVPYLCPNNDYRATYFINGALQLLAPTGSPTTVEFNISSGICFKSQNITYFAYSENLVTAL